MKHLMTWFVAKLQKLINFLLLLLLLFDCGFLSLNINVDYLRLRHMWHYYYYYIYEAHKAVVLQSLFQGIHWNLTLKCPRQYVSSKFTIPLLNFNNPWQIAQWKLRNTTNYSYSLQFNLIQIFSTIFLIFFGSFSLYVTDFNGKIFGPSKKDSSSDLPIIAPVHD